MREDILRHLKIFGEEKSKVKVKALTLTKLCLSIKSKRKIARIYCENIFLETREKDENFDIKFMILREELDLL